MSRKINYRDVRSTPPRVANLSDLKDDLGLITRQEVIELVAGQEDLVLSVNGQVGDVVLDMPEGQVPSDWNATEGVSVILNKPSIPVVKRSETYIGITNASGLYSVTYPAPYSSVPDVQPQLQAGTPAQVVRIISSTVSGFTVAVTNRASVTLLAVEVLLAATTPVVGASVSVLVTAR